MTPISIAGEPQDDSIIHQIEFQLGLHRQIVVAGYIEPARQFIHSRHPLDVRHFEPIVHQSPFVPNHFVFNFALGFARFFQGDYVSAFHLLVPQLENAIRHILDASGVDTSTLRSDDTQSDRALSALLEHHRSDVERVFGSNLTFDIDILFNNRFGPRARHELAHGKVAAGQCFLPDYVFCMWFIYHLTCRPLASVWAEVSERIDQMD